MMKIFTCYQQTRSCGIKRSSSWGHNRQEMWSTFTMKAARSSNLTWWKRLPILGSIESSVLKAKVKAIPR